MPVAPLSLIWTASFPTRRDGNTILKMVIGTLFFESCRDDEVIHELARLLVLLQEDLTVVLLTARPLRVQPQTLEWLERHQLRWDLLCMRSENTIARTADYKRETVHQLRDYGFELLIAFEDDRRNAEMFHSEGIPCVYIHSGYYE